MSNFVVVKFHDISTYGSNPYKCVPAQWVRYSDFDSVTVPYPTKFKIFEDFETIIYFEAPIEEWKEYNGIIVRGAGM
ncbi:GSCOCG00012933001-RA-CDS [Cotesia congregata]|nr:GSCOCG00012933001-RA-CDS [Cotesia congregata]